MFQFYLKEREGKRDCTFNFKSAEMGIKYGGKA